MIGTPLGIPLLGNVPRGLPRNGYVAGFHAGQYGSVLSAGGAPIGYLEQCADCRDYRDLSKAIAGQATGSFRPLLLSLFPGEPHYAHLAGGAGNYLSVPDNANMGALTDFALDVQVALNSYASGASQVLMSRWDSGANLREWRLEVTATGFLQLLRSSNGTGTGGTAVSTLVVPASAGQKIWLRACRSGGDALFYYSFVENPSANLSDWTQLGTTVVGFGSTVTFTTVQITTFGAGMTSGVSTSPSIGRFYRARLYRSAVGGGTIRCDIDARKQPHGAASFSDETGQVVTVNQSGANPATLIGGAVMRSDGTDDVLTLASGLLGSFRQRGFGALFVTCNDNAPAAGSAVHPMAQWSNGVSAASSRISISTRDSSNARDRAGCRRNDGDGLSVAVGTAASAMRVLGVVVNWAAGTLELWRNGVPIATGSPTAGLTANTDSIEGALFAQSTSFLAGDIAALTAWNEPLSARDFREITSWHAKDWNIAI